MEGVALADTRLENCAMAIDPEELLPRKKPTEFALGQDLSALSEFELAARIELLEGEIARARQAIAHRKATRSTADTFFKKK